MNANRKRDARGRLLPEPVEATATHRRCNMCRQWVAIAEYGDARYRRGQCRLCRNEAERMRSARLTTERLDAIQDRLRRADLARSKQSQVERRKDAEFAVNALIKKGWTRKQIHREAKVHRDTITRILEGEGEFIYQRTVDKLYDALGRNL